jgi:hypothetical protein
MKIGDPNAPWFPSQWGPETSDTRRCEHGKLGDEHCPECDEEIESEDEKSRETRYDQIMREWAVGRLAPK